MAWKQVEKTLNLSQLVSGLFKPDLLIFYVLVFVYISFFNDTFSDLESQMVLMVFVYFCGINWAIQADLYNTITAELSLP